MLHEESPNSRTDNDIGHSDIGVLSTVIELEASEEPKKKYGTMRLSCGAFSRQ